MPAGAAAIHERAYAKLNFALHVRGREADGYHRIETLFVFAEDGDTLRVAESGEISLEMEGPFGTDAPAGPDNLVVRAAEMLRARAGVDAGAALRLTKCLPVAAGLGGGSADAAAALRLLRRFWGLDMPDEELVELARSLGADVPACLSSSPARGERHGDVLTALDGGSLSGLPLLVVNPGIALATGAVFSGWDGIDRGALPPGDLLTAARRGRNDLEASAIVLVPPIASVLDALRSMNGIVLTRMSGSGASCFALFEEESRRDAAAARILEDHPEWWQLASRIR